MSKRARFDGPSDEVAVFAPDGTVYDPPIAVVKRGAYLPDDLPASLRDELGARDNWTLVDYTPPGAKKDKGE